MTPPIALKAANRVSSAAAVDGDGDRGQHHHGRMAEREEEADRDRPLALLHQLARDVVDGGDVIGVDGVAQRRSCRRGAPCRAAPDSRERRAAPRPRRRNWRRPGSPGWRRSGRVYPRCRHQTPGAAFRAWGAVISVAATDRRRPAQAVSIRREPGPSSQRRRNHRARARTSVVNASACDLSIPGARS